MRDGAILYDSGTPVANASEMVIDTDMSPARWGADFTEQYVVEGMTEDIGDQSTKPAQPKAHRQTLLGIGLHR